MVFDSLILSTILMAGLIVRLLIAPAPGYEFDVGVNQGWAKSAVELGLARSYSEQVDGNMLPNYPPFSLMIFANVGHVYKAFISPEFDKSRLEYRILIKLPAMLADLGTALLFFFLLKQWKNKKAGFLAAAAYTFHPAVLYESAYWGQTDSIFTFFLVLALSLFASGRMTLAGVFIAVALFTKVQTVMLGPLFLMIALLAGWKSFLKISAGAAAGGALVLLPFFLGDTLMAVIKAMLGSVGYYSIVSSAAYNFWWMLFADAAGSMQDTDLLFDLLSYRNIGFAIFGIANLWILFLFLKRWRPHKPSRALFYSLFAAASFLAFTFFLFSTQMHERYLFPFIALGLPLAFINRRGAFLYAAISLLFLSNLMGWLPLSFVDRALFRTFPTLDVTIAACQFFAYIALLRYVHTLEVRVLPGHRSLVPVFVTRWKRAFKHHKRTT
ncbi:hypothetical protein A3D88_02035 [Candidatus Peribacteria bacterium RIFCSPHIGHO2_02_FULL_52_16]|nr:MAG: hypothetical protein A2706_00155 [Candidatus Peribacteria bacterium RIFCSPHIGHO2_01_FULL_51_35]OGJ61404.1 MAG: hypothetical protein A3D88_02035 [Candidatus Peribacteria bacterium RIFCSPHIGHO2_02_FULL_52_16]